MKPISRLICTVSSLVLMAALAGEAAAQTSGTTSEDQQEATESASTETTSDETPQGGVEALSADVLITARRRNRREELQRVPLSVTAYDAARLEVRGFRSLTDISYSTPNVALDTIGSAPTSATFSIRGLSTTSSIQSLEPAVGTFIDGTYLAVNAGVISDLFDVESVEVLRGPQGTLFGRNVTGGAVLINSRRPTHDLGIEGLARLESGLGWTIAAAANTPIVDGLYARVASYYRREYGWATNRGNEFIPTINGGDERLPNSEDILIRPSLLWEPMEGLDVLLRYEYYNHDGTMTPNQNQANFDPDTFQFAINYPGFSTVEAQRASMEVNWRVGPGSFINILSYRHLNDAFGNDLDGTINTLFHLAQFTGSEQWSEELRYSGTVGRLDFTAGVFYYNADLKAIETRLLGTTVQSGGGTQSTESFAIFTENQFHITDALSVTAGIRYTHERKEATITQITATAKCGNVFPVTGDRPCLVDAANSDSWDLVGFRLGTEYQFNNDIMAYASFTRGFRSGGFNVRQVVAVDPVPFDPERADAWEVGFKATWLDRRARTNLALFWNDVSDFQRTVAVAILVPPFTIQSTANAADARFRGFEVEQSFRIMRHLLVSGYVGHIDADYTELFFDVSGNGVIDANDFALAIPRVPEWTYGAQITVDVPIGSSMLTVNGSWDHRDPNFFTDNNQGRIQGAELVGARASLRLSENITIAAYARNLLNEVVHGGVTPIGALFDNSGRFPRLIDPRRGAGPVGTLSPFAIEPRAYGLELRFNF